LPELVMSELEIIYLGLEQLKPYARNARVHSRGQIRQLASSIRKFGFTSPLIIDEACNVLAGHGRLEAAKLNKMAQVPCVRLSQLSPADKRAYRLADNKLAQNSRFDLEILAAEVGELVEEGFDLTVAGFEVAEIDLLISDAEASSPTPSKADRIPEVAPSTKAVSRLGDLWRLGRHRLLCGDARDVEGLARLMQDEHAAMAFLDPPYNRSVVNDLSRRGAVQHAEFAMGSGEMSRDEFTGFLQGGLTAAGSVLKDGAIAFVCMDWRHMLELQMAGEAAQATLMNLCVWNKSNAGQGQFYRSKHELIYVWKFGNASHTNNFKLGESGRSRNNVWSCAGSNSFGPNRIDELRGHPTPKPVDLIVESILDVSHRGELVLDSFAGSGSTLIAAHKCGRTARLVEYEPSYCDLIIRRFQAFTGKTAIHANNGLSFEGVEQLRNPTGWGRSGN
jgi:DNA modification methylase